jgi:hypothetical protein
VIAALVSLVLLAPAPAGAGGAPPVVSLSATPSRLLVDGRGTTQVEVANAGRSAIRVTAAPDGLALDLRGRPTLRRATPARWLHVAPRELSLLPGRSSTLTVRSSAPTTAKPGDHHAVLLLTTRPLARGGVSVRMRVGVRVVIRVPGAVVRRLRIERLRVLRGRRLEVTLANAGNVTEELARGRLRVELRRAELLLARLHAPRRELLPNARAVVSFGYPRRVRGAVTAVVLIRDGPQRSFRVRLRR